MENQNINLIENENKSTKSKVLTWVSTILLACAVGVCAVLNAVMPRYQKSNAYYVNDLQEYVEFSAYELNNYDFQDLANKLQNANSNTFDYTSLYYNNIEFELDSFDPSDPYLAYIDINGQGYTINFDFSEYRFKFSYQEDNTFEYPIYWYSEWLVHNIQKQVTLTASELNNNTYTYLLNKLDDISGNWQGTLDNTYIIYNNNQYVFADYVTHDYVDFSYQTNSIQIDLGGSGYPGRFFLLLNGDETPFTNSITIYSDYIVDNLYAPTSPSTWLDDIIALLSGGIVGLSHGVGSGTSTLISDIFITNNALSVFGGMIVVFAGISLAIGLCRWVMNFLTSLGAKK